MPNLDFLIHMPLLRIEEAHLPFGPGELFRMPFAKYSEISLGAFSEHQAKYEATEPVFLAFSEPIPEEGLERRVDEVKGMIELKAPTMQRDLLTQLGLDVVNWAHDTVATPVWSALLLAAPAAALAPPRWSQTFMGVDGGFTMRIATGPAVAVRVQGEADHEYLFQPDAASERIPSADIARAAEFLESVREWDKIAELRAAMTSLRATGVPVLSRQDRLTIAVQALESLLLPEVHTTLKKTFAHRVATLLTPAGERPDALNKLAADLYSLRSESVHGAGLPDDAAALEGSFAEVLLAAAIRAVGALVSSGQSLDAIRQTLEKDAPNGSGGVKLASHPIGHASDARLAWKKPSSDVYTATSSMVAPEHKVVCWSPLLGLATEGLDERGGLPIGDPASSLVKSLSPEELFDLEERDVRRDFMAEFVQHGHAMAVLFTIPGDDQTSAEATTPWLERMRDLSVITLRLAEFGRFHDPELFGSAVFEGRRRLRRPTAIRQTVAESIRHEAEQRIGPADRPRMTALWADVWRYETGGPSPQIERALSLFRRSFDRQFLNPEQRALVLVSLLESMLGRFRSLDEPVQLEDLLGALATHDADVAWFRAEGRAFRNRVAHGEFQPDAASLAGVERFSRLTSDVLLELIKTWNGADADARRRRPSALLIARATGLAKGR